MGNAILSLIFFFFYIYKFPYGSDNNQFGVFIFLPKKKNTIFFIFMKQRRNTHVNNTR